jgi:hypothetical protein
MAIKRKIQMSIRRLFIFIIILLFCSAFLLQQPDLIPELKSRLLVPAGHLAEYPDLAIDSKGAIWIVYMQMIEQQEQIVLRSFRDGAWADSLILDRADFAYRPSITVASNGTIWASWARGEKGKIGVVATSVSNGQKGQPEVVSTAPANNWQQEMTFDTAGRLWLAWEQMQEDKCQIIYSVRENGRWQEAKPVFPAPHRQMRPTLIARQKGEVWCAWDAYLGNYDYDIFLRRLDQEAQVWNITNSPALEQCPALSVDSQNRLWLAWHSNAGKNGKPDIPRWLVLRQWEGAKLFSPIAETPDKDLEARESLQSWEFPTLLASRSRAIWLFGRPSQEFSAQVFLGERWSRRKNFALSGWGGRGQFVRAAEAPDGTVWTVRRDIGAIELCGFASQQEKPAKPKLQLAPEQPVPATQEATAARTRWAMTTEEKNFIDLPPNEALVFGDLHQHSSLSDGMGTVDDCYTRSRDLYNWDFAALTDHEWFVRNRLLPSEWEYIKSVTASFNAPEDFITIPAYEWTSARWPNGAGHKNVYFLNESKPIYSVADTTANVTPKLFAQLKAVGAIAFPHHIGWTGVDWQNHDPLAQPNVEIVSVHGAFEYMGNEPITHRGGIPGMFMQNGLAQGLRFGVLGASDGHGLIWHHGIGRKYDPWIQGLAGVWIKGKLTRESLFEALKARRVYATSGTRILLYFSSAGHPMGSEYAANAPPKLIVRVAGSAKIRYIYLLRDNEAIHQFGGDFGSGELARFEFIDQQVSLGTHWYYVRIIQEDGEMAWSSPIWVKVL